MLCHKAWRHCSNPWPKTLANGSPSPSGSSGNVANYMGQMAMAMGKLGTLEGFLRQAGFEVVG
uniref:Uncharacterized protein n=1 Tax=Fagus sylvatica TaxID=28930 RepID=A0A2N9GTG9_FAGSY